MTAFRSWLLLLSTSLSPALAADDVRTQTTQEEILLAGQNLGGFVESHPDLRNYRLGLQRYRRGDLEEAFRYFLIASLYSDKPE